ncbi:MAG: DinB family protein [Cytophagaceae bacterium]
MDRNFDLLEITRNNMIRLMSGISEEQLFTIPAGFNNNIIWNAGHSLNSQQKLIYGMAGIPLRVPESFSAFFSKGTSPSEWQKRPDVNEVKKLMLETVQLLKEDYKKGVFKTYKAYPTSYGFELKNIEDAIVFNNVHEGLHLGTAMALKKIV